MLNKIKEFLRGNRRYALINSWFKFLVPLYIREQYKFRFNKADKRCHRNGKCIACGCKVPHVFLANKGCRINCYPPMMSKEKWFEYKHQNNIEL